MKRLRFSIARLMVIVVAIAIDLAVIRAFDVSNPNSLPSLFFISGVMPMATTLFVIAIVSARRILRGDWLAPFVVGYEAFGWLAVFAFVTLYSIAPSAILDFVSNQIGFRTRPSLAPLLDGKPEWVGMLVEFGAVTVIFSLPQLTIALFGGWLFRKLGLTLRFGRHEWSVDDDYGTSHDAGVKGPSIEQRRAMATSAG